MVHRPVPGTVRQLFGLAEQLLPCLGHSCQSILQPSCTSSAFPFSVPLLSTYIHVLSVRVRVGSRVCCRDFLPNNTCCASRSGSLGSHAQSSLSFLLAQQRDVRCFLYLFFFGSQTEERSLPMNSELTGQAAGSSHAEPCERGGGEEGGRLLQPCLASRGCKAWRGERSGRQSGSGRRSCPWSQRGEIWQVPCRGCPEETVGQAGGPVLGRMDLLGVRG